MDDSARKIHYLGSSMGHSFRPGDLLYVVPYGKRRIRCGDVVVFIPPGRERKVVHRVVSVAPGGIRTKGDNSSKEDHYLLDPGHILGRVVYAKGRKRRRRIHGGVLGKAWALKARMVRLTESGISSWILRPLRRLIPFDTLRRMMHHRIPTRIIAFNRPEGTELQLLLGSVVMGRLLPGRKVWDLRRPVRWFVAEESLPAAETVGGNLHEAEGAGEKRQRVRGFSGGAESAEGI